MTSSYFSTRTLKVECVAALLAMTACASVNKPARTPEAVVREFAQALSDGKADAAYALLSAEYQQRVSLDAWRKQLDANPQEVSDASNRLAHVRGPARHRASLLRSDGSSIECVNENGSWLIAGEVVQTYDQSTPRAALRSFVDALQHRRYDVLLRLMPEADKESVTTEEMEHAYSQSQRDEVERLLTQLRPHMEDPIEITGEHATLPYAEHRSVRFVRETGQWRIASPR